MYLIAEVFLETWLVNQALKYAVHEAGIAKIHKAKSFRSQY